MKLFWIALAAALIGILGFFSIRTTPGPSDSLKIARITGVVNVVKDGAVIMALKPGDAFPEIKDGSMTFVVASGSMEMQYDGGTITAGPGSSFTVTSSKGRLAIALGPSAPVAIKTKFNQNLLLTPRSEVTMVTSNDEVEVGVGRGDVVASNSSGGEVRNIKAGETASLHAPAGFRDAPGLLPNTPEPPSSPPPSTTVIPTQTLEEGTEVSGSNP
ncbi:MAG: hypothetical protein WCW52_02790 [Elusimicrobiales bacterium]